MNKSGNESLANLFDPEPFQWGLRGDPFAWREMRETLRNEPLPASETQLHALLSATLAKLLGGAPLSGESVYVERFAHGGMSSGRVCLVFWRDTALPLLCQRFSDLPR